LRGTTLFSGGVILTADDDFNEVEAIAIKDRNKQYFICLKIK